MNDVKASKDVPIVCVFNKIDQLEIDWADQLKYNKALEDTQTVSVSALTGDSIEDFATVIEDSFIEVLVPCHLKIPYNTGEELNQMHKIGNVDAIDYCATSIYIFFAVLLNYLLIN